jgi:AmiR/NasT family two-component response regulator
METPKTRILIAEDESVIALNLHDMLERAGYEVVGEAGTGKQAIEMTQQLNPDVILMDIKMPEMDGLTAAREITKQQARLVIMLTAYYDNEFLARAKASGVFGYIVKPVTEQDLVPAIEIASAQFADRRAAQQEVVRLEETLANRKLIERAKGVIMQQWRISEAEAYRRLQKESQDKRIPMAELAKNILDETGMF